MTEIVVERGGLGEPVLLKEEPKEGPLPHMFWDWENSPRLLAEVYAAVKPADLVCDVGCGDGRLISLLSRLCPEKRFVGLDVLRLLGRPANDYVRAPAERLPFKDAALDAVLCTFVLEYVDKRSSMQEISRVLRPYGRAVFVLHHPKSYLAEELAARGHKRRADVIRNNSFSDTGEIADFFAENYFEVLSGGERSAQHKSTKRTNPYCYFVAARRVRGE